MKNQKWKNKLGSIRKKVRNHIMLRKEVYFLASMCFLALILVSFFSMSYNYIIVKENKDFYREQVIVKYDQLVKDLKDEKITHYSRNSIYPNYLDFKDIWHNAANTEKITTYKFTYTDKKTGIYQTDSLKSGSLDAKENKELGTTLFKLTVNKGVNIDLLPFALQSFFSTMLTIGTFVGVIIMAQFLISEVVSGKNFSKKVLDINISFYDIIGYTAVKEQFLEIADYLKNKQHYKENDLVVPMGILLTGDPGVGKTMFAKAFANEVKATLFFASGADFAELYVGVGAKRVRSIFRSARIASPAIIFIDEFDAIGSRNNMGNDSERLSVINQLLTEMDGFNKRGDVFVIATTNYQDKIDPALLRPGRIDKIIHIPTPDKDTRKGIIEKYLGDFSVSEDVKEVIAIRTQSYSGASIKSLVDGAKSLVAKKKGIQDKIITLEEFAEVQENSLLGLKQTFTFKKEQEKRIAYHELGHALLSTVLIPSQSVEKITIEPRGKALGFTMMTPIEEVFLYTKQELLNHVCVLLAGRAAEEIFIGDITNGAADDLQKANKITNDLLLKFGMSEESPLLVDIDTNSQLNLNNDSKIERAKILLEQYNKTKDIIIFYKENIETLAIDLIDKKSLNGVMLRTIVKNKPFQS